MGRKAWLFANTPAGAKASSVMYSIVETAKENGLHPYRYVEYLLETLPNATISDMESMLPWSASLPATAKRGGFR
ncbi:transposase domain-containing protein [Lachnospiraceae bacterium ZAX-1]